MRDLLVLREAYDRKWAYGGKGDACGWDASLTPEATALLNASPVNPKTLGAWALKKKLPHALNYTLQELRVARFRILELREKMVSTGLPEMFLLSTALLRIVGNKTRADATDPHVVGGSAMTRTARQVGLGLLLALAWGAGLCASAAELDSNRDGVVRVAWLSTPLLAGGIDAATVCPTYDHAQGVQDRQARARGPRAGPN